MEYLHPGRRAGFGPIVDAALRGAVIRLTTHTIDIIRFG